MTIIGFIVGIVGFIMGAITIYEFIEKRKLTSKAKNMYTKKVEPKTKELIKKVKERYDL